MAEHVKPSVVFIKSGKTERRASVRRCRCRRASSSSSPGCRSRARTSRRARAPGFIVSKDGYILTNDHVVDGSDQVTVRLLDRREFKAKVVGTDPGTDLAVLKIDADNLTPAPLGDSDAARVGEWVLAVGNPLGENLTFTVTSGIISAKGRTLALPNTSDRSIQDFIQTDAAINPGNSGGPLVSVQRRGASASTPRSRARPASTPGYGFAIPINLARRVMDQIIAARPGRARRAGRDRAERLAQRRGVCRPARRPRRGGRGLRQRALAGQARPASSRATSSSRWTASRSSTWASCSSRSPSASPGETVKVEVARKGGVRKTLRGEAAGAPGREGSWPRADSTRVRRGRRRTTRRASIGKLGITVAPVDDDDVQQLQLTPDQRGALVTDVKAGGPSYGELVDPDHGGPDIILEVEGTPVRSPADLRKAISSAEAGQHREPPGLQRARADRGGWSGSSSANNAGARLGKGVTEGRRNSVPPSSVSGPPRARS